MSRHCVLLAGGLGTRLREVTHGVIPKVLVPVLGRPFLDYKLFSLRAMGVDEVTILAGELGSMVVSYVHKLPEIGIDVRVIQEGPHLLGTAGAIRRICGDLPNTFWVTYGDSYVIADLDAVESSSTDSCRRFMTVLKNCDEIETSNVNIEGGRVITYAKPAVPGRFKWIDYGLVRLQEHDFAALPEGSHVDLGSVFQSLINGRELWAWQVNEWFWDVGNPAALLRTEETFKTKDWKGLW